MTMTRGLMLGAVAIAIVLLPLVPWQSYRDFATIVLASRADKTAIHIPNQSLLAFLELGPDKVEMVAEHLRPGMLVILESTTYPGTTDEVVRPILEKSGLVAGQDFFLAFSPERVDPGNAHYTTRNVPKVVGGTTPACTALARTLYSASIERVVEVSSPRVAEPSRSS